MENRYASKPTLTILSTSSFKRANKDVNAHAWIGSKECTGRYETFHTDHVAIVFIDGHVGSRIVRSSTYIIYARAHSEAYMRSENLKTECRNIMLRASSSH
jgi:hypothetical protein